MKTISTTKKLKKALYKLLCLNYSANIYTLENGVIRISIYHLNSVYNGLATTIYYKGEWSKPIIDWQYHPKGGKEIEKQVYIILECMIEKYDKKRITELENIFNFFDKKAKLLYDAKYSIDTFLFIENASYSDTPINNR